MTDRVLRDCDSTPAAPDRGGDPLLRLHRAAFKFRDASEAAFDDRIEREWECALERAEDPEGADDVEVAEPDEALTMALADARGALHEAAEAGALAGVLGVDRVSAKLPGTVVTVDGTRAPWALDGRPLRVGSDGFTPGDTIELLIEGDRVTCDRCDGEGRVNVAATRAGAWIDHDSIAVSGASARPCPDCGARGSTFAPVWIPASFEHVFPEDGSGDVLVRFSIVGASSSGGYAIRVRRGDELRCRWPVGGVS